MNKIFKYTGSELELFRQATKWKAYCCEMLKGYLAKRVLEVGAGIGNMTKILCTENQEKWVMLEPDPAFAEDLRRLVKNSHLEKNCEIVSGVVKDLRIERKFDTIIYVDVLEHIEDDIDEINQATNMLDVNGVLIILSPAYQWLFSPFDEEIGHYRRYNKKGLKRIIPDNMECIDVKYMDSIGLLASLGNKIFMRSKMPTMRQIKMWDRCMIPVSKIVDPIIGYKIGRSILGIWRKCS